MEQAGKFQRSNIQDKEVLNKHLGCEMGKEYIWFYVMVWYWANGWDLAKLMVVSDCMWSDVCVPYV